MARALVFVMVYCVAVRAYAQSGSLAISIDFDAASTDIPITPGGIVPANPDRFTSGWAFNGGLGFEFAFGLRPELALTYGKWTTLPAGASLEEEFTWFALWPGFRWRLPRYRIAPWVGAHLGVGASRNTVGDSHVASAFDVGGGVDVRLPLGFAVGPLVRYQSLSGTVYNPNSFLRDVEVGGQLTYALAVPESQASTQASPPLFVLSTGLDLSFSARLSSFPDSGNGVTTRADIGWHSRYGLVPEFVVADHHFSNWGSGFEMAVGLRYILPGEKFARLDPWLAFHLGGEFPYQEASGSTGNVGFRKTYEFDFQAGLDLRVAWNLFVGFHFGYEVLPIAGQDSDSSEGSHALQLLDFGLGIRVHR